MYIYIREKQEASFDNYVIIYRAKSVCQHVFRLSRVRLLQRLHSLVLLVWYFSISLSLPPSLQLTCWAESSVRSSLGTPLHLSSFTYILWILSRRFLVVLKQQCRSIPFRWQELNLKIAMGMLLYHSNFVFGTYFWIYIWYSSNRINPTYRYDFIQLAHIRFFNINFSILRYHINMPNSTYLTRE